MHGAYFTQGHLPDPATFGCVRLWDCGVTWREIEKSRGVYDWSTLDAELALLLGKEIIYTFGKTPQWASMRPNEISPGGKFDGGAAPPSDVDGANQMWKDFVTAMAKRYNGVITAYEIWN